MHGCRRARWIFAIVPALFLAPSVANAAASYRDQIVALGPIAYWRLGETSGTTARDEIGAYNGTYYGPTLGQTGTSPPDKAPLFDGVNDYVDVGCPGAGGTALTLMAWIKPSSFSVPDAGILSKKRIWTLLFVVADPAALTAQETTRKTLLESWGYKVNLIDEADTQTNFNTAAALADVAYVSSNVLSMTLDTKLKSRAIGVVMEEVRLNDEMGFASNYMYKSRTQIRSNRSRNLK